MTWRKTGIGGEFHFRKNGTLMLNLSINKQLILEGLTDVNWYISKIIPVLRSGGYIVESYTFNEHV